MTVAQLTAISAALKNCLCTIVNASTQPVGHCRYQPGFEGNVGQEGFAGIDMYEDECCSGVAYVAMGDVAPSIESFPEPDIVRQASVPCGPPAWAVSFRAGILRCAPRGTDTRSPTDADWDVAYATSLMDAVLLSEVACCFREWFRGQEQFVGMALVISRQQASAPQGGCMERFVDLQVQIPNLETGCGCGSPE